MIFASPKPGMECQNGSLLKINMKFFNNKLELMNYPLPYSPVNIEPIFISIKIPPNMRDVNLEYNLDLLLFILLKNWARDC